MLPQTLPNIPMVSGGSSVPPWVLRGGGIPANIDLNFAAGLYYGGSPTGLLSITNSTGGYVTNADGSLTWVYGAITNISGNSANFLNWASAHGASGTAVLTANFAASPVDGTISAGRAQLSANADFALVQAITGTIPSTGSYVGSIWMRSNTASTYSVNIFSDQGTSVGVSVTPTWQRFFAVESLTVGATNKFQVIAGGNNIDILIWGGQINALPYATATAATLTTMPYVPTPSVGTSAAQLRIGIGTGLLVEEARTNLLLQSNAPNSFTVPQSGCTAVANITDPALVASNAWTITQTGANGSDSRYQSNLTVANDGTTYAISAYVLKQTGTPAAYPCLQMQFSGGVGLTGGAVLDTVNGIAQTNGGAALTGLSVVSSGAFWRVSFAFANNGSGNTTLQYQFYPAWNAAYSGTKSTVLNGANGFAFGQVETGSFATSYIPTLAVAVARAADTVLLAGAALSVIQGSAYSVAIQTSGTSLNLGGQILDIANGVTASDCGIWRAAGNITFERNGNTQTLVIASPFHFAAAASAVTLQGAQNGSLAAVGSVAQVAVTKGVIGTNRTGAANAFWDVPITRLALFNIALGTSGLQTASL